MQKTAKPSFWLTRRGHNAVSILMSGGTSLIIATQILPHSLFSKQYIDFIHMYRNGAAVPVKDELVQMSTEVINKCDLTEQQRNCFKYFTPIGFDICHVGSSLLSKGAFLGIPYNFRYNCTDDVDKSLMLVDGGTFNFASNAGHSLVSSLVLSDNAKRFAIAREVYSSITYQPYVQTGVTFLSVMSAYATARVVNLKFNLYAAHRSIRLVLYGISSFIGFVNFCLFKDMSSVYFDKKADNQACSIGEEYCRGGIEFYEKTLERNKGLREALGDKGKSKYTSYGNEQVLIRTKRMPITDHLEIVKNRLNEYEKPPQSSEKVV